MGLCNLSVFLEEFGATININLPQVLSEKEQLLLKLLMQGMSVTEISQYRNRSAKTISHQKNSCMKSWVSRAILPSGGISSFCITR